MRTHLLLHPCGGGGAGEVGPPPPPLDLAPTPASFSSLAPTPESLSSLSPNIGDLSKTRGPGEIDRPGGGVSARAV